MFYCNHQPISNHFRVSDFSRKSQIMPIPCILCPCWLGSPWNLVSAQGVKN